jgi:hypothetical protein
VYLVEPDGGLVRRDWDRGIVHFVMDTPMYAGGERPCDDDGRCSERGVTHHADARQWRIGEKSRCRKQIGPGTLNRNVLAGSPKA